MGLDDYLRALWKWWWLLLLCSLCGAGIGFLVSTLLPPVYEAKAVLMLNQSMNTGMVDYASTLGSQQVLETYRALLKARPVLETVLTRLDLPYTHEELAERIQVDTIPNTQLLVLRVEDRSPRRAADVANEVVFTFLLQRSTEQQSQEIKEYEQILVENLRVLRESIVHIEADIAQSRTSPGLLTEEELARLQTNQSQLQGAYANLLSGYLGIQSMKSRLLDVSIVEPGQPSSKPTRPRRLVNTILAAAVGAMLAAAIAVLMEYLDDTIKTLNDVSQTLGLATLSVVGRYTSKEGRLIVADEPISPVAEAFRILYANLRFSGINSPLRTLLVTSSDPVAGKSLTVANLAVAMAQIGHSVVVVDADFRHPRLGHLFGFDPRSDGLSKALLEGSADGRLHPVQLAGLQGLRILPSGELPPNPMEMVSSAQMQKLLRELAQQVDMVLIDSPPVLPVADAVVLAQAVDGVLLVLRAGKTRREAARRALERIQQVDANVVGVVLNDVRTHRGSDYYRQYYKYYGKRIEKWKRFGRRQNSRSAEAEN